MLYRSTPELLPLFYNNVNTVSDLVISILTVGIELGNQVLLEPRAQSRFLSLVVYVIISMFPTFHFLLLYNESSMFKKLLTLLQMMKYHPLIWNLKSGAGRPGYEQQAILNLLVVTFLLSFFFVFWGFHLLADFLYLGVTTSHFSECFSTRLSSRSCCPSG